MGPYDELDVNTWRRLLAQAVLLHATADKLGELHLREHSSQAIRRTLSDLQDAATEAGSSARDDDEAVRKAIHYWCERIDRLLDSKALVTDVSDRQLLEELRSGIPSTAVVNPFEQLFTAIAEHSAVVYRDYWRQPELSLGWLSAHPRAPTVDAWGITASAPSGPPPQVKLMIYLLGFGPAAYAVIPWFLVHECVCHVPARQGGKASNSSQFAEGFMDWAAGFFFERWISLVDSRLSSAAKEHHDLVDRITTIPETKEGAARLRGRRAAERIVEWLVKDYGRSREESRAWVARLAVNLNCCDVSLTKKDALIVFLNSQPWPKDLTACLAAVLERRAPACNLLDVML